MNNLYVVAAVVVSGVIGSAVASSFGSNSSRLTDRPQSPSLPDPFQIVQNEQKQTIKLDRRTGECWTFEDGVAIRYTDPLGESRNLLDDKEYVFDNLVGGGKMTVTLKWANKKLLCSLRVWPSQELEGRLILKSWMENSQQKLIEVDCYSENGVRLTQFAQNWNAFRRVAEHQFELQTSRLCPASLFADIKNCQILY